MRSLMILLFLLACTLQISNAQHSILLANSNCCPKELTKVKIPIKQIEYYYWTSDVCATRAIVYKTYLGKHICVNPESAFVKSQIEKLVKKTKSATESSVTTAAKSATATTFAKSTTFTTAEKSATSTTSAKSTTFTTAETSATAATSTTSATAATSTTSATAATSGTSEKTPSSAI